MTREELLRYGKDYLRDLETACCEIDKLHLNFVRESIKVLSQEPTKREIEREYLFQSLCEDFKKLQAENDDLKKRLEQEPCEKCVYSTKDGYCQYDDISETIPPLEPCDDAISRKAVLGIFGYVMDYWKEHAIDVEPHEIKDALIEQYEFTAKQLNELPSVTQNPIECKDAISRSDMLDAIGHGTTYTSEELQKIIQNLPSVNPQPCDDAVSREAILSKIKEVCFSKEWTQFRVNNGSHGQRDFLINYIEQLPSVTQKSGKWNEYYTSQKENDVFNCKECGHTFVVTQGKDNMNFCPNCSAKMESEVNNE